VDEPLPSQISSDAVADSLGVAEAVFDRVDPASMGRSLARAFVRAGRHPGGTLHATRRLVSGLAAVGLNTAERAVGRHPAPVLAPEPKDARFRDRTWSENAWFAGLLEAYLVTDRFVAEVVESAALAEPAATKARFAARLLGDALAPTNALLTNPVALRRAFETGGLSAVRGMRNLLHDLRSNGGWPRQVDTRPFVLGENMAATPGRVVYRNDLIELIQYEAQTDDVHEVPLVFCPPWINKYYIMDLAPGKSLVEWAVRQGMTSFAISYRNPDSAMRDLTFADYLLRGPKAALEVVREITGAPRVNTLAVCLGGTLHTALLAYLDAIGEDLVHSSTYLNSFTDFGHPGTLGLVFADEQAVDALVQRMEAKGYLDGADMAHTFDLLRANDLVFRYVESGWLLGDDPPAFDLLAWNGDCTRMPAQMHTEYLRSCYLRNDLAHDRMELAGERLEVSRLTGDVYIVAAVDDHIVPWQSSYATTQSFKGDFRFVLSSSGHIAGIVNPPNPKSRLWTNDDLPPDPENWRAGATERADTWWNDWIAWLATRSGPRVAARGIGSEEHPAGVSAPGGYVFG
jgi:polyhydroxyalkanoate synthase subunit PhaC